MTRTGIFIRRRVRAVASLHCARFILRTRPDSTAATNTPVPAAESQLIVKRAASGFALGAATGGIRCTRLCRAGISQPGSESVPLNLEPRSVVLILMSEKRPLRYAFQVG